MYVDEIERLNSNVTMTLVGNFTSCTKSVETIDSTTRDDNEPFTLREYILKAENRPYILYPIKEGRNVHFPYVPRPILKSVNRNEIFFYS